MRRDKFPCLFSKDRGVLTDIEKTKYTFDNEKKQVASITQIINRDPMSRSIDIDALDRCIVQI